MDMRPAPSAVEAASARPGIPNLGLQRGFFLVATLLYAVTHYLYTPTLPLYTQTKTQDLAMIGLALSMYGLWQTAIRLPLGIATDRVGWCKPFIIGGFALAALGSWLMGSSDGIVGLMIGRSLTGVSAGIYGLLIVVFSGLFLARESVRASTILTAIGSLGIMVATSVTGFLNELGGYPLSFYVAAGAALVAILILLPAHEKRRAPRPVSWRALRNLITRRDVLLSACLCAAVQYAATATSYGFLPILASDLGAGDVALGLLLSIQVGMLFLGSVATVYLTRWIPDWTLVGLGLGLLSLGVGLAAVAPWLWVLVVAQCLIGFSWGVCYPVASGKSIKEVADHERSTAMGVFQTGCSLGVFAGSWVSGVLAGWLNIRPMFGLTALGLVALALWVGRKSATWD